MFENLLYQNSVNLLVSDLKSGKMPSAMLFSGPECSGKLTCALELARILSCTNEDSKKRGKWTCECASCRKNKELSNVNVLLAGPKDCLLEILASKKAFLQAKSENAQYIGAVRYLFIRAVKKLTHRFSQVLLENDDKISKIAPIVQEIDENLEILNVENEIPELEKLEKITESIVKNCEKLESNFMYDSIPVEQIRNASYWARISASAGKKVLIFENAERMNESARNALLKILEEPPEDAVFVLTTSRRGAVMPTILSRVRTYNFSERTAVQQHEVIERVFHDFSERGNLCIEKYLQSFLPVSLEIIKAQAEKYYSGIENNQLLPLDLLVKECNSFEPGILFRLFLEQLLNIQRKVDSPFRVEFETRNVEAIRECYNAVSVYNQSPLAALEKLYRDFAGNRKMMIKEVIK